MSRPFDSVYLLFLALFLFLTLAFAAEIRDEEATPTVDDQSLQYAKGSACNYCDYCKFCKLCDKDCPCETSPQRPNCKMCKYCKFCYLCKICDTICQPGGLVDRVTAKIVNALPTYNKDEVDKDIDSVRYWINKKDEL
ncbi:uncharacterized protein LOC141906988 [Tubulanus polymorphus]|uniref:uncharacterized protein LOC141906988 n=1 Tax=Tubulanus polymorphus TaxID=672921 RepID=UPI003DA52358